MNKVLLIGDVKNVETYDGVSIVTITTVNETRNRTYEENPPRIKAFGPVKAYVDAHVSTGDTIRIEGAYASEKFEGKWEDYVVAFLVTHNLHMNLCRMSGYLGRDAESYQGDALGLALSAIRFFKGKKITTWVKGVLFGNSEKVGPILTKGKPIFAEGRIVTSEYGEKDKIYTSLKIEDWQAFGVRTEPADEFS